MSSKEKIPALSRAHEYEERMECTDNTKKGQDLRRFFLVLSKISSILGFYSSLDVLII